MQCVIQAHAKRDNYGCSVDNFLSRGISRILSIHSYFCIREVKKNWMGGGGFRPSPLFTFFFTFNVKIMSKKHSPFLGGAGGGFQVSWTKSIQMFVFFNFPKRQEY